MNKKALFVGLLIVAVLAITGVVLFTLRTPVPNAAKPAAVTQPLPDTIPVTTAPVPTRTPTTTKPAPVAGSAAERERQAREKLFQVAQDLTARLGTYSNADGFAAITSVYPQVTSDVKTYLEQQRIAWQQAHPGTRSWGQTTRALTTSLVEEKPVLTATTVEVLVDTQQRIDDAGTSNTSLKRARLQLTKQGDVWVISRLSWEEVSY